MKLTRLRSRALAATYVVALAALALSGETAAAESRRRWACEPGACRAGFVLHTFWHDVEGETTSVTALLESESGHPLADGAVTVTLQAASLGTGIDKRDRKMREEHLETAGHPLIEFRSTALPIRLDASPGGSAGAHRLELRGELTLHGVAKALTLPIELSGEGEAWVARGRFKIRLSDFGIPDPSVLLNKVDDEVEAWFEIRLSPRPSP